MSRSTNLRLSGLSILATIVAIVFFIAGYRLISDIVSDPFGYPWTLDEINKHFSVPIPQDATDINYSGRRGLGAVLNLDFKAPPDSANLFATSICNGGLYEGYDPFDSVNVGEPITGAHQIQAGLFSYYSYSPDTPETILGNRCGAEYQIRVDISNPITFEVKSQVHFSCSAVCYPITSHS